MKIRTTAVLLLVFAFAFTAVAAIAPPVIKGRVDAVEGTQILLRTSSTTTLRVDVADAIVQDRQDRTTLAAIAPGAEVILSLSNAPAGSAVARAAAISVLDGDTITISGTAESSDEIQRTVTIAGQRIKITDQTTFANTLNATTPRGPSFYTIARAVGFSYEARNEGGELVAVRIGAPLMPAQVVSFGAFVVEQPQADLWIVRAGDGRTIRLRLDQRTQITGAPQVDDFVNINALIGTDEAIALSVEPGTAPTPVRLPFAFLIGELVRIDSTSMTIVRGQTEFALQIMPDTVFTGARPQPGDTVLVHAQVLPDGTHIAREVSVRAPSGKVTVVSIVTAVNGNEWTIGSRRFTVVATTVIQGNPGVGDLVYAEGDITGKDTATAILIAKR